MFGRKAVFLVCIAVIAEGFGNTLPVRPFMGKQTFASLLIIIFNIVQITVPAAFILSKTVIDKYFLISAAAWL